MQLEQLPDRIPDDAARVVGTHDHLAGARDRLPGDCEHLGRLLVGLGGSATTDGGAGLLAGLGAVWRAPDGAVLEPRPAAMRDLDRVDLDALDARLAEVDIQLACDVTNPLLGPTGAAAVFGPQKGATPEEVPILDGVLAQISAALVAAGAPDVRDLPGAGAAGGLGAALLALHGRRRR
ncbi:MAG: glycerate kinase, partial [Propionicimonas sp.]|nr:glycerate kinase [Propionicimonas sp.]